MPSRDEWLHERNSVPGIGASESAALFGLHPYLSAFALFEKLVNPKPPTAKDLERDADVKAFGLAIEPYLSKWYARRTGRRVMKPSLSIHRLEGKLHVFASLDNEYVTEEHDPEPMTGVLELKSAMWFRYDEPLPDHWQVQNQQQMLCSGHRIGSFAILGGFSRRYLVNDIPRRDEFCSILVETIDRFMDAVYAGSWDKWGGDLDGSKSTTEALRRLYPKESGKVISLPPASVDLTAELETVQDRIEELQFREEQIKNMIRSEMKDASYAALPDGSGFSNKTVSGSTFTVVKQDHRQLRRVKQLPKGLLKP